MDKRDQLMTTAARLIDEFGVHETGLDVILREAAVSKTTFYKHFESKDEVAIAAVRFRAERSLEPLSLCLDEVCNLPLPQALLRFFDAWDQVLFESDLHGCLFLKVCSEFPNPNDAMHQAGQLFPVAVEEMIIMVMKTHGVMDPETAAKKIMIILQGYASFKFVNKHRDLRPTVRFMLQNCAKLMVEQESWEAAVEQIAASD